MNLARVISVVLVAVVLQVVFARYAVGGRLAFDLVLVGVVFVALQGGAVAGMLAGTLGGLLTDLLSGGIVGVGGLLKTIVGCLAGVFGTQFVVAKPWARALIVAAATPIHALMALGLETVMDKWPGLVWTDMLGQMALNAIAGYVAFYILERLPGAMARRGSRRRSAWGRRQW